MHGDTIRNKRLLDIRAYVILYIVYLFAHSQYRYVIQVDRHYHDKYFYHFGWNLTNWMIYIMYEREHWKIRNNESKIKQLQIYYHIQ